MNKLFAIPVREKIGRAKMCRRQVSAKVYDGDRRDEAGDRRRVEGGEEA
jgi:hypothetical protein